MFKKLTKHQRQSFGYFGKKAATGIGSDSNSSQEPDTRENFKPPGSRVVEKEDSHCWFYQTIFGENFYLPPGTEVHISRNVLTISFTREGIACICEEEMQGRLTEIEAHLGREGLLKEDCEEFSRLKPDGRGRHIGYPLKIKACVVNMGLDD